AIEDASAESLQDVGRWQMQIDLLRGKLSGKDQFKEMIRDNSRIEDGDIAYLQNVKAQQLFVEDRYDEAVAVAMPVLEWAQRSKDTHLEISVHSTLGGCYGAMNQI